MTRQEFLKDMREALTGEVSTAVLNENMEYFETYIMEESRKGRTEEEVLEELGNPRLIAKTIIDTHGGGNNQTYEEYKGYEDADKDLNININGRSYHQNRRKIRVTAWALAAIIIVVVVLLLLLVGSVLSFLAPVLVPALLVLILVGVLSGKK